MGRVCNAPAHRAWDPCARNNKAGCHSDVRVSSAPALPRGSSADPFPRLCPRLSNKVATKGRLRRLIACLLRKRFSDNQTPATPYIVTSRPASAPPSQRSYGRWPREDPALLSRGIARLYLSTKIMARRKTSKTKMDTWRLVCAAPNPLLRAEYATPWNTEPVTRALGIIRLVVTAWVV